MNGDQLHFEKYLLDQSKKRLKVTPVASPTIMPIELKMDEKMNEYLWFGSKEYLDSIFSALFPPPK